MNTEPEGLLRDALGSIVELGVRRRDGTRADHLDDHAAAREMESVARAALATQSRGLDVACRHDARWIEQFVKWVIRAHESRLSIDEWPVDRAGLTSTDQLEAEQRGLTIPFRASPVDREDDLGAAWDAAEAALPRDRNGTAFNSSGGVGLSLTRRSSVDYRATWGVTDYASGPTPAAALRALADALAARSPSVGFSED